LLTVDAGRDLVSEVDGAGFAVWSWNAGDHILPYGPATYTGHQRTNTLNRNLRNMFAEFAEGLNVTWRDWTHVNSAQRLANGNTIISLRNFDLVIEVNHVGQVVWTFGPLVLKHQHCAWVLPNGHLLVTDNGNARVIED